MKKARFIVALAIILGCSTTASAQFGVLVKKAKKAVTEKVQDKVKETRRDVKNQVTHQAMEKAGLEKPEYDPNRKYKPSKEALAADPQANDQTIEEGFTKSIGEIHACFEQFSDIAPYGPYYTDNAKKFWGMGDSKADLYGRYFSYFSYALKNDNRHGTNRISDFVPVKADEPQVQVPADEYYLNFWTCRFMADPKSETALKEYMYAYTWLFLSLIHI